MVKYIFSLFLVISGFCVTAQTDSVVVVEDSIPKLPKVPVKLFPGVSASFDYGKFIVGFSEFEKKMEFTGHLSVLQWQKDSTKTIQRLQVSGEYGTGYLKPNGAYKNGNYEVDGNYFRLGLDYMRKIDAKNNIGLGFRYGSGTFSDQGEVEIKSNNELFPDYSRRFERVNKSASWWEAIIITEGKLFRIYNPDRDGRIIKYLNNLYIGGNIRLRFNVDFDQVPPEEDAIAIYAIPGYGRAEDNLVPAFNLFIKYKLDFN